MFFSSFHLGGHNRRVDDAHRACYDTPIRFECVQYIINNNNNNNMHYVAYAYVYKMTRTKRMGLENPILLLIDIETAALVMRSISLRLWLHRIFFNGFSRVYRLPPKIYYNIDEHVSKVVYNITNSG